MKSSNPPRSSMQTSNQVNQRASQQNNNPSVLNTQNLMGQTVLNTVYPSQSQVQNSKQMSSTVKSTQVVNSQAKSNNSIASNVSRSKATVNSIQLNQSNQPGSTMQSKLPTVSQMVKEDPVYPNSSSYPKQPSIYNKSTNSQQQIVYPSQQQSVHPSQQQSMRPSQQQSMRPSQQQSIHPSQQQSMRPSQQQSIYPSQQQSMRPPSQQQSMRPPSQQQSMRPSQQQSIHPSQQQSMRPSQQQSIHPSQQQSIHPSQQQSMRPPSQQQSMRPSQQQSIHPSQQQSMQYQKQSMKNQSINSQQQQGSIRPGSQMGNQNSSKNPNVKISRKSSVRTSRNKSPPLVVRTKDGQIKASGSDFNGNKFYVNADEVNNEPEDIVTHLSEYLNKEISIHSSRIDIPKNNKPGNGFRFYGQLTKAGRNQNGKTKTDQDTPLVHLNVGDIPGFNLFGVLDGHGPDGHHVSRFCRDYFIKMMIGYADYCKQKGLKTPEAIYEELKKTKFAYIYDAFQKADTEISKQKFDFHFSGTTCNIAIQLNKYLISANVGDSRSILVYDKGDSKNQGILPLSRDHKPDLPGEVNRILSHGGTVDQITDSEGTKVGPQRVWKAGQNYPGLAMSRSLGDFEAKACGVISTPEIIEQTLSKQCRYIAICSDGVWEFIQNEQVRDLGNVFLNKKYDVGGFCDELVKFACHSWEQFDIIRDDITVVSVFF